jgi:hypothetical protein
MKQDMIQSNDETNTKKQCNASLLHFFPSPGVVFLVQQYPLTLCAYT